MLCPVCKERLFSFKSHGYVLDACPKCEGIWFDEGEFAPIAKILSEDDRVEPAEFKPFQTRESVPLHKINEEKRICPRCKVEMKKINYGYDSNIYIDKCGQCKGVWTDTDEIKHIASYLKRNPQSHALGKNLLEMHKAFEPKEAEIRVNALTALFRVIVPLGDDVDCRIDPIATVVMVLLCVGLYVFGVSYNWHESQQVSEILEIAFAEQDFVRAMLIHGGILNVALYVISLWIFGDVVEERFGRFAYITLFIYGMLAGGLLGMWLSPNTSFFVDGIVGAIGAIIGAYFIYYPTAMVRVYVFWGTMKMFAVIYFSLLILLQIIAAVTTPSDWSMRWSWLLLFVSFLLGAGAAIFKKEVLESEQSK